MSLCSSPNRSHNDISVWFSSGYFLFRSSFSKWRWKKRPKSSKIYSKRWVFDCFFGVFLIKWYSCVCSCNFTRQEGGLLSIRGGRTGRNWSTSPEYVGVPFDWRCDCDCHGSCGWQIGSLSASSTPTPTPLAQHSNNHVTWCTATLFFGPVSVGTLNM